ncbi:hypothetical protein SELMODRAFT_431867 [Selaginella moellendorffii]|uniref:DUF4110 domain-containing protein n=1 Tax=Selaginella moellendorffii TaxID=88036 RepID=D8TE14_SELML|nr:hypothetical protein SELMODRAFT_431867 [Selaginella moellendorffii]
MEVNTNNGDKTYVYGDLYQYNIEKNEWKPVTSPNPPPREALTRGLRGKTGSSVLDLWRLDLNTNMCGWSSFKLKGCPGARSGHRLKHKLILFGGFYDTLREERYPLELLKPKSLKIKVVAWWKNECWNGRWKGYFVSVWRYERSRRKKSDTTTFPRWTFDVWKCIIEETQSAWIEASKEKGETDGDNSHHAGSINKGKDEEDDDEVVKKKDWSHCEEAAAILRGEGKKLTQKARKLKPGETLRDFFSWTIMYWQMAPYDHTQHTGKELRKDGFDLAKTRYRELKPVLDKLTRLEADHNAEEEATKSAARRNDKVRDL